MYHNFHGWLDVFAVADVFGLLRFAGFSLKRLCIAGYFGRGCRLCFSLCNRFAEGTCVRALVWFGDLFRFSNDSNRL